MDLKVIFDNASLFFGSICFFPYIYSIVISKKGKPIRATWFIWGSLDIITLCGMHAASKVNGQIVSAAIGAWIIFFLSLYYGKPGFNWLDRFCLGGAIISILLWQLFDSPLVGIIVSSIANGFGALPTLFSAWEDSRLESKWGWILGTVSSLFAFASISVWTPENFVSPLTFFVIQVPVLYLLFIRAALPLQITLE